MDERSHPGFVMNAPGDPRQVWVRAEDCEAWERRGYTVAEATGIAPDSPPAPAEATQQPDAAEGSPAHDPAASGADIVPEPEPEPEQPTPAVTYPRSRGRNSAPRG